MKTITIAVATVALFVGLAAPAHGQASLYGFVEYATGANVVDGDVQSPAGGTLPDYVMRELRLQLKSDLYGDVGEAHFRVDVLADEVRQDETDVIVREGYVKFNAFDDNLEVRAGRQPTTWGTGDLLFINDLFPKDYVSFFIGRDDEYLKSPSDVLRFGLFSVLPFNVDLVLTPQFAPDVLPVGERLTFFAPAQGRFVRPAEEFENGEAAVRLNRYYGSWNYSLYGYTGFWKGPQGFRPAMDPETLSEFYHPELNAFGASARGPLFGGVAWAEGGYYDSSEDSDGDDPFVPNSEYRAMIGFERQWWSDFTGGMQFYWEGMQDHDAAVDAREAAIDRFVAGGMDRADAEYALFLKDENRTLITLRLRQQFMFQTLTLGFFGFYSPSDEDSYLRASVDYDYSDSLTLTLGTNWFTGEDQRTLFGMNDDNDNVYARIRYGF
jgi:hypothetical protein